MRTTMNTVVKRAVAVLAAVAVLVGGAVVAMHYWHKSETEDAVLVTCDRVGYGPGDVEQIDLDNPRVDEVAMGLRAAADDTRDAVRDDQRWRPLAKSLDAVAQYAEQTADRQRAGLPANEDDARRAFRELGVVAHECRTARAD
ncbi:hypothetical protein ACWD7T_33670 [Streptomyces sp. 900116325]